MFLYIMVIGKQVNTSIKFQLLVSILLVGLTKTLSRELRMFII